MAVQHIGNNWYGDTDNNTITGSNPAENMYGYSGDDTLKGMGGNDFLQGGLGNDNLQGGAGDDTLIDLGDTNGATGNQLVGKDKLDGGAGNDLLVFQSSDTGDIGDGGSGTDTVRIDYTTTIFSGQTNISFRLLAGGSSVQLNGVNAAFITAVERLEFWANSGNDLLTGGDLDDKLYGEAGNDTLKGLDGDDYLDGGSGIQDIDGGSGQDTVSFDLSAASESFILKVEKTLALGSYGKVKNFEAFGEVWTGSGGDTVETNDKGGTFHTGGGTDQFTGGKGKDIWDTGSGADTGDMGGGNDQAFAQGTDRFDTGAKNLHGGAGDDFLGAAAGSDHLFGDAGNDSLDGGKGTDSLEGGDGNDDLEGGAGVDTLNGGDGNDFLEADRDRTGFQTTLTYDNDVLNGGNGNDGLMGGFGADELNCGAGNDTAELSFWNETSNPDTSVDHADGGTGDDTLNLNIFYNLTWKFDITIGKTTNIVIDGQTLAIAKNFEALNVSGTGTGDQKLTGGDLHDSVWTSSGNDIVNLLGGDDYAFSYIGSDTVNGGDGNDQIHVDIGGKDTIDTGDGNDLLALRYYSDDTLDPDATYDLGRGKDILSIQGITKQVTFDGTHIFVDGEDAGTVTGYELLKYYGSNDATTMNGTDGNDALYMGSGNDTVNGGKGDDLIDGGAGNDKLDGGAGNNTLSYESQFGAGIELTLNGTKTLTVKVNGVDTDTVKNFENVVGGGQIDTITGDSAKNTIDGYSGNDILKGMGGDDHIIGGSGQDVMTGGSGADAFVFESTFDFLPVSAIHDLITDFKHAEDRIDLSALDANGAAKGNGAFTLLAKEGAKFTGEAGQLAFEQHGKLTTVAGDIDGDKHADFFIDLSGKIDLTKVDFML